MASLGDSYHALDKLALDYFTAVRDHGGGSTPARDVLAGTHSILLAHGAMLSSASRGSPVGDAVGGWARKRVRILAPDEPGWTSNPDLVADLEAWCVAVGVACPPNANRLIGRHLGAMGAGGARDRTTDGLRARGWRVKLLN